MDYHVAAMKPGSVIVDLAASTGGNCALTKNGEVYTTDNGVVMVGKLNQLPSQASQLYGNNLCHLLDDMGKAEKWKIDMEDAVVSRAMVTYNGKINWPPAPLPVSPTAGGVKKVIPPTAEETKISDAEKSKKASIAMLYTISSSWCIVVFSWTFCSTRIYSAFHCVCFSSICWMAINYKRITFITYAFNGSNKCD
jgi:hypothetical protein